MIEWAWERTLPDIEPLRAAGFDAVTIGRLGELRRRVASGEHSEQRGARRLLQFLEYLLMRAYFADDHPELHVWAYR